MEGFATPDELPQPLTPSAEGKYTDTILLVDLSGGPVPARKLEPFRLAGIPLLALIRSGAQREAAYQAGFDDYLLCPVSAAELKARLAALSRARGSAPQIPEAALERERRAAVGRLTSYFCHAVNNSMQTIRGAIDLAREEKALSPEVAEYLTICRKETEIIGAKIARLRQIYRPKPQPPEALQLGELLREALKMATDELLRNNVNVKEQIEPGLPAVHSSADRLSLALLMILFHLGGEAGSRGGGELRVKAARGPGGVQLVFDASTDSRTAATGEAGEALPPGLDAAEDLIRSERGRMRAFRRGGGTCLEVRFPAGGN